MRLRKHHATGQSYVEVATWDGGSWAGIRMTEFYGDPRISMLGPISHRSYVGYGRVDGTSDSVFFADSNHKVRADELGRWMWLFRACVPGPMVPSWWPDSAWPRQVSSWIARERPGRLSPGFDPEPYLLLGELHPVWSLDRSWLSIDREDS